MSMPTIAARADIHKSCKTFEAVVNYLNDYNEAVTAIIGIQKKLARALRDAASTKTTSEVAANALNASATVFDSLCEVDTKFAKLVDSECEGISSEVKKWFKRLAKEERAHDEKVANASGRIKQAGMNYEKKVKKNPADAVEEHARYISLLTTLGTETNQEKYNHSLMVTQRHEATLFSLAACLSRVADAEWLRVCEGVRRVSPNIGQVGEWRVLCEGNWTGPVPPALPETDSLRPEPDFPQKPTTDDGVMTPTERSLATPAPEYASRAGTPAEKSPQPPTYFSPPTKSPTPQMTSQEGEDSRDRSYSVNSIASLGSFPSPPNHFPIPPIPTSSSRQTGSQSTTSSTQPQSQESVTTPSPSSSSSPIQAKARKDSATFLDFSSPPASPSVPVHAGPDKAKQAVSMSNEGHEGASKTLPGDEVQLVEAVSQQPVATPMGSDNRGPKVHHRGEHVDDTELDSRRKANTSTKTIQSVSPEVSKTVERSDSNRTSASVVAAMREKYSRNAAPASPPPKEVPRLPLSVSNLATRYDSSAQSPEQTSISLSDADRARTPGDIRSQTDSSPGLGRSPIVSSQNYFPEDPASEIMRRRQRIQELEELEAREQEYALRMKEKEIRERAREYEREQLEMLHSRHNRPKIDLSTERSRPQSTRPNSHDSPATPVQQHPYASSGSGPISPPSPRYHPQYSTSQPPSPMFIQPTDHGPSCGCESCTKYRARDSTATSRLGRPTESAATPRPEKSRGGWIRRLSMPVMGNAFSDNKKGISSTDLGSQAFYRSSLALPEEDGRLRVDVLNNAKNRSVTSLVRR